MKLFVVIVFIALLSGCATSSGVGKKLDTMKYHGFAEWQVTGWMGYPTRVFYAPNGNKVFQYTQSAQDKEISSTIYHQNLGSSTTYGGADYTRYCHVYIEFFQDEVVNWSNKGNSCNL